MVVIMAVAIVLAVLFIVLALMADEIEQGETVMGGKEIDAAAFKRPWREKIGEEPDSALASAPVMPASPRQNRRMSSRARSFHSRKLSGKLPS